MDSDGSWYGADTISSSTSSLIDSYDIISRPSDDEYSSIDDYENESVLSPSSDENTPDEDDSHLSDYSDQYVDETLHRLDFTSTPPFGSASQSRSFSSSSGNSDKSEVILENPSLSMLSLANSNSTLRMPSVRSSAEFGSTGDTSKRGNEVADYKRTSIIIGTLMDWIQRGKFRELKEVDLYGVLIGRNLSSLLDALIRAGEKIRSQLFDVKINYYYVKIKSGDEFACVCCNVDDAGYLRVSDEVVEIGLDRPALGIVYFSENFVDEPSEVFKLTTLGSLQQRLGCRFVTVSEVGMEFEVPFDKENPGAFSPPMTMASLRTLDSEHLVKTLNPNNSRPSLFSLNYIKMNATRIGYGAIIGILLVLFYLLIPQFEMISLRPPLYADELVIDSLATYQEIGREVRPPVYEGENNWSLSLGYFKANCKVSTESKALEVDGKQVSVAEVTCREETFKDLQRVRECESQSNQQGFSKSLQLSTNDVSGLITLSAEANGEVVSGRMMSLKELMVYIAGTVKSETLKALTYVRIDSFQINNLISDLSNMMNSLIVHFKLGRAYLKIIEFDYKGFYSSFSSTLKKDVKIAMHEAKRRTKEWGQQSEEWSRKSTEEMNKRAKQLFEAASNSIKAMKCEMESVKKSLNSLRENDIQPLVNKLQESERVAEEAIKNRWSDFRPFMEAQSIRSYEALRKMWHHSSSRFHDKVDRRWKQRANNFKWSRSYNDMLDTQKEQYDEFSCRLNRASERLKRQYGHWLPNAYAQRGGEIEIAVEWKGCSKKKSS